jgi:transcriptional regulator with XRE-family HTH domain
VLIRGEHLPADVRVLFAGKPTTGAVVCRPVVGEVDVTTPVGLVGDVEVRVEARDDPSNGAALVLRFMEREVPRPYHRHISGQRLRVRREALGLTQKQVAERTGSKQPYISALERNKWAGAPDELYVRLAEVYGMPLSSFLLPPSLDDRLLCEIYLGSGLGWDSLLEQFGLPANIGIVNTMTLGQAKERAASCAARQ